MRRDRHVARDVRKARLVLADAIGVSSRLEPPSTALLDDLVWHEILTCLVECWAEGHGLEVPEGVRRALHRPPVGDQIPDSIREAVRSAMHSSIGTAADLSVLGTWYEEYRSALIGERMPGGYTLMPDRSSRKNTGAFYTPPDVVDYILARTLGRLIDAGDLSSIRVLDPACGAGSFLTAACHLLVTRQGREDADAQRSPVHLYGMDLDPRAAQLASVTLLLEDAVHWSPHSPVSFDITCGNALVGTDFKPESGDAGALRPVDWQDAFPDIPFEASFDLVVGNPPWVSYGMRGVGTLDPALAAYYRSRYPHSAEYKIPIYPLFLEKAIRMTRNGGYCGFVLPDSFLLGKYFSKIRRHILDMTAIEEIVFFEEDFWPVGRIGRTVAIILRRESNASVRREHECVVSRCRRPADLRCGILKTLRCPQQYFESVPKHRFRLFFDSESRDLVARCEAGGKVPLASIASVHTGVRSRIGQRMIVARERRGPRWRPGIVSGRQVKRYRLTYEGHFIRIDPAVLWGGGYDPSVVGREKLIMRQTGDSLAVAFDGNGYYHLNNCHSIVIEDRRYDAKYLLAILNSRLMNRYYQLISLEKGRALAQTDIDVIEGLPIPPLASEAQQPFVACVEGIIALVNDGLPGSTALVDELLHTIDENVDRLYGCTGYEEVQSVDQPRNGAVRHRERIRQVTGGEKKGSG